MQLKFLLPQRPLRLFSDPADRVGFDAFEALFNKPKVQTITIDSEIMEGRQYFVENSCGVFAVVSEEQAKHYEQVHGWKRGVLVYAKPGEPS